MENEGRLASTNSKIVPGAKNEMKREEARFAGMDCWPSLAFGLRHMPPIPSGFTMGFTRLACK